MKRKSKAQSEMIERISDMEQKFDSAREALARLRDAVDGYRGISGCISELSDYYSGSWKGDFLADENGELPPDLKRGVLSEDGLWNFFEENRELAEELAALSAEMNDISL